jgi:DNA-binding CsgD family transcriptional regulator
MKNSPLAMILSGEGTEMFQVNDNALIAHNRRVYDVADAPANIKDKITVFIEECPKRKAAYIAMAGNDKNDQISQCIKCMFANLDGTPDIDKDGNIIATEYVSCSKRGSCKFEGVGCNKLVIGKVAITRSQERVVMLCSLPYKVIADELFLSIQTVKRHMQDVLKGTGIPDKTNLALEACKIGLLN